MTAQDEQAFLAAIVAAPDDDTPRLVFADWLDERAEGDDAARAALIRAQCQLEHYAPGGKERRALEKQAKDILKEHGARWAKDLRDAKLVRSWGFRRGFLEDLTMSASNFADMAEELFQIAPTIRAARFPEASNEVDALADCPYFARLASVDLSEMCSCGYCPIHNDLRALFNSKHAQRLTKLNIAGDRMDATGAKRLAASKALANLTELDLSGNALGADSILVLSKSKYLTRLTSLDLSNLIAFQPAAALADPQGFPSLAHLALRTNGLTAGAVQALVAVPLFAQLTSLDLRYNMIRVQGAKALAALPSKAKLEAIDVRGCHLTENTVRALKKRFGKGVKV